MVVQNTGDIHRRPPAEHHGGADHGPWTGVSTPKDRSCIVADGIQTQNGSPSGRQHPTIQVGSQPGTAREVGRPHRESEIRPWSDFPHTRIRLVHRVAIEAVQFVRSPPKILINAGLGVAVMTVDALRKNSTIDADFLSKFRDGLAAPEITRPEESSEAASPGMDETKAIIPYETTVADQKTGNARSAKIRSEHSLYEVVIRIGLVHKASAGAVDGDQSRFCPVEHDVRKY